METQNKFNSDVRDPDYIPTPDEYERKFLGCDWFNVFAYDVGQEFKDRIRQFQPLPDPYFDFFNHPKSLDKKSTPETRQFFFKLLKKSYAWLHLVEEFRQRGWCIEVQLSKGTNYTDALYVTVNSVLSVTN